MRQLSKTKMMNSLGRLIIPSMSVLFLLPGLKSEAKEKPNVLFISVDDLNDWVEPLEGHPQALTPNFDKLSNQGINFTNAHCSAAVSTASRNSLLSGIHPSSSG